MPKKQAYVLFGLLFVVVGAFLGLSGSNKIRDAKASLRWPTTEGKIVASEIHIKRAKSGTSKASTYHYRPDIAYEYAVSGMSYTSQKVAIVQPTSNKPEDIKPIVNRYGVGDVVTVHYDPAAPDLAVLEPGVTGRTYIPLGLGILFGLVGAAFVVVSRSAT